MTSTPYDTIQPAGATPTAGGKASESDMVFEAEEQPALPPEMLKKSKGKAEGAGDGGGKEGAEGEAGGGKKASYVGDGVRYRFNEGTGEWEEAPPGEGESDEEEEEQDGEDDGEGEEEEEGGQQPQAQGGGAGAAGQVGAAGGENRKRKKKKKSGWDKASNKWIYVTGLPADVTGEEVGTWMEGVGCSVINYIS